MILKFSTENWWEENINNESDMALKYDWILIELRLYIIIIIII